MIQFMVTPFHSLRKPSSFAMIRIVYASRDTSDTYAADGRVSARRVRVNLGLHASSHNVERIRAGLRDQRRHCAADHALQRRRALALIDVILEELAQRVKNHPRNARVRKDAEERGVDSGVEGSYALDVIAASHAHFLLCNTTDRHAYVFVCGVSLSHGHSRAKEVEGIRDARGRCSCACAGEETLKGSERRVYVDHDEMRVPSEGGELRRRVRDHLQDGRRVALPQPCETLFSIHLRYLLCSKSEGKWLVRHLTHHAAPTRRTWNRIFVLSRGAMHVFAIQPAAPPARRDSTKVRGVYRLCTGTRF